jgi:hypothetical protein
VEVMEILSIKSLEATAPAPFSTETAMFGVNTPPDTAAVGSTDVNPNFAAVVGYTAIAPLVTVKPASAPVLSVAVNAHEVPAVIVRALNVATPEEAVTVSVPPSVHPAELVEMVIESVDPAPVVTTLLPESSTETERFDMATPKVAAEGGPDVYAIFAGVPAAEAGEAVTSSAPPTKRAEHAPTERTLWTVERSDRPPPRFFNIAMVIPLSIIFVLTGHQSMSRLKVTRVNAPLSEKSCETSEKTNTFEKTNRQCTNTPILDGLFNSSQA